MKALRVLTGVHAGAGLSLAPGRYRIAATAADTGVAPAEIPVTLIDWDRAPLVLVSVLAGQVAVLAASGDAASPTQALDWPDLEPRRFGSVVLCVGEADAPWPSDAELLAGADGPRPVPREPRRRPAGSWGMRAGFIGAGLLVAVGALYGRSSGSTAHQAPPLRPDFGAELLQRSLSDHGLNELRTRAQAADILLSGLVRNAEQARTVRLAVADIEHRTGVPVSAQWEVADDIASTIDAALRHPGVHARYTGAGRFQVEGVVADPAALSASGEPLAKDLGANVKGIDFALERIAHAARFSSAVAADALRYSERPDGAKVFSRNPRDR